MQCKYLIQYYTSIKFVNKYVDVEYNTNVQWNIIRSITGVNFGGCLFICNGYYSQEMKEARQTK